MRLLLLMLAILSGCSPEPCRKSAISLTDSTPRLAVMSAFAPEMRKLLDATEIEQTYIINGRTYSVGRLGGNHVVLVQSGISMVNAAMVTQTALDHFQVTGIIFSGIAGGVNPDLNIGDVVVPSQWGEYQEQVFARRKGTGWDIGWHGHRFGNFGMMFPQAVQVTHHHGRPDQEQSMFWFTVDPVMLDVARQVADSAVLRKCTFYGLCLPHDPTVKVGGNGVSGPTFVENAEYREWVWETFEADALDMETAAVAHVAYANDVPYLAFRSLSDLAGGETNMNKTLAFFQVAADNAASVVISFLEAWAKR
jgi:adenosylhomocysteine nucleosidase